MTLREQQRLKLPQRGKDFLRFNRELTKQEPTVLKVSSVEGFV